jgi:hypothetical protein
MPTDPILWEKLPQETKNALWKAAQLADAPLPPAVVTGSPGPANKLFSRAVANGLAELSFHPIWGQSLRLSAQARAGIRSGGYTVGGYQLDLLGDLTASMVGYYYSYFLADPRLMRQSAAELEPHLDIVAELARRLEMWEELAHLLHRRALYVAWEGGDAAQAARYAAESVQAFRKTSRGNPHPGVLALLLTGWAHFLERIGNLRHAVEALLEAEDLIVGQVGAGSIQPFLVYCQLAHVYREAGDEDGAEDAADEARTIAAKLGGSAEQRRNLAQQLQSPRAWAFWDAEGYAGL